MNVFITGATGLIGSVFSRRLIEEGHCVTVLTRDALRARKRLGESVRCISSLSGMDNMDDFDNAISRSLARTGIWKLTIESITGKCKENKTKK